MVDWFGVIKIHNSHFDMRTSTTRETFLFSCTFDSHYGILEQTIGTVLTQAYSYLSCYLTSANIFLTVVVFYIEKCISAFKCLYHT